MVYIDTSCRIPYMAFNLPLSVSEQFCLLKNTTTMMLM